MAEGAGVTGFLDTLAGVWPAPGLPQEAGAVTREGKGSPKPTFCFPQPPSPRDPSMGQQGRVPTLLHVQTCGRSHRGHKTPPRPELCSTLSLPKP